MNRKTFYHIAAAFLFVLLTSAAFGQPPQDAAALSLQLPVARELKSDDAHYFLVAARENEILEIACERRGVDVALAAFSPGGEKISISNAPGGFAGTDRLVFVSEKTGEYQIELKARRPGDGGEFTLLLTARRAATERDLDRAKAMKYLGAARDVLSGAENRLEKAERALESLNEALELFEKTADLPGQANALFHLANINGYELGNKKRSIEFYEKALEIWEKIDDPTGKAICLTYLADELRDYDSIENSRAFYTSKAQTYFDEALKIYRKTGDTADEATALSYLCRLHNDSNNFQKGFEACREALRLEANRDPLTGYRTHTNLASLYSNSGDLDNALKHNALALERLEIVKGHVNPFRKSFIKTNIGGIYLNQKKYAQAETNLREAFEIAEQVKRKLHSAYILVRLGLIYFETDRLPEALESARKAVEYYREIDPVKIQAALNGLGKIQAKLGRTESARALFTEAIELNRLNKDRYAEADSLYNLAKLENQAGNLETARRHIELAIGISEIIRSEILGKNKRTSYLSILKRYYELEIEVLAGLYEKTAEAKYSEQAWQMHEKIRARNLMENLLESGLNLNEFAPPDFFIAENNLLEEIAAVEFRRTAAVKSKNAAQRKAAEAELSQRLEEYELLQEKVRQQNPRFSAINQPRTDALADAQQLLDENTAILEFALGERRSYVWVIRKDSFHLAKLPSKKAIEQKVREFYRSLTDREAKTDAAIIEKSQIISRELFSPIENELQNLRQIVVIADGALQLIPFSALTLTPDAAYRPLVEDVEIVTAPSFSSIAYLRENKANRQKQGGKLLAIFADPIFQNDDERFVRYKTPKPAQKEIPENLAQALRDFGVDRLARLPFSGIEAREIGKFAPEQTFLALGADASRQNFLRGDFNSYRILHFATHGFLNQQNPELSGLVLSLYDREGNAQNGFLRVIDLYSLRVNSDLVVLSACQTALGKEIDGEGLVGLTRGFLYAGAAGVVSSLWKVEDAATAELMKRFYRAMLTEKQSPSAALRTAKNEMRRIPRFRNPRYWSGFTLNGDWR